MSESVNVCRLHAAHDLRVESAPLTEPGPGEVTVAVGAGGICGSDLHYFHDGGIGPIRVREPIILGHEAAGRVVAVGPDTKAPAVGALVAINPSHPCERCGFCTRGLQQHCERLVFLGSAMYLPHAQGLFRDRVVVPVSQCEVFGDEIDVGEAACTEPLAVCLHAAKQADSLFGRRVLVTGAGPIGALCVAVARAAGADEIVVTDLHRLPLEVASRMGADHVIDVGRDPEGLAGWTEHRGRIDTVFECSAAAPAIRQAVDALRPRGTLIQVGVASEASLPLQRLVGKEIRFLGSHRFHREFAEAARAIDSRRIDVRPIVTGRWPLAEANAAFEEAGNREKAVKVQLRFDEARQV